MPSARRYELYEIIVLGIFYFTACAIGGRKFVRLVEEHCIPLNRAITSSFSANQLPEREASSFSFARISKGRLNF